MEQNDLLTIIILVVVAIAVGIILSRFDKKKKVCTAVCDYENKCDDYCLTNKTACPQCPACPECVMSQNLEEIPMNTTEDLQVETTSDDYIRGTVIEPIDMSSDNMFVKPMYVSVMNTDLKSSCGSIDKVESRQQMLGAPFPTNYKSMMA